MLVIFDGRAQSVPLWLAASGFSLWEGVEVAGAQYRIPYVYKVFFFFLNSPNLRDNLVIVSLPFCKGATGDVDIAVFRSPSISFVPYCLPRIVYGQWPVVYLRNP